jgi:hypothetical protein
MAWKRVYVPGKGWRYTDGKGNYKTSDPSRSRYRNPANDVVDAGTSTAKKGVKKAANTVKESVKATSEAAGRTAKNEEAAKSQAMGYKARKDREKQAAKTKPQSLTERDKRVGNTDVNKLRQQQNETIKAYNKSKPDTTKPSPAPSTSRSSTPAPARSSGSTSSTAKPSPKPVPKPAGKVPASSETYRDGGKGLYQGSKEYRDKVGGSGNPLLNRFRKDMGRDASSGSKAEPKMSKPEDKSRYVAPNGQPYKGPAFGNDPKPAKTEAKKKEDDKKKMSLAERMRRRRAGLM